MIAHKFCMFLSFYLILSVDFVLMGKQTAIFPSYFPSHTFSEKFINSVNNIKTYKEQEIQISVDECVILKTPIRTHKDIERRDNALKKFNEKMEDIKCTCSLIVKTKMVNLMSILEELKGGEYAYYDLQEKLINLKEEVILMLLLFHSGKVKAGKWILSYLFKIIAIIEYDSNKSFIGETPFEEDDLQSGITHFIQQCKDKKYLPKEITESDVTNSNIPLNLFKNLQERAIESCDDIHHYNYIFYVDINYLYLKPLWDKHDFFFGKITGSEIDWKPTLTKYAAQVEKTKEYVKNRQWISKPFGLLSYHKMVKQIISVRMYTFMWVMLVIFKKEMPKMGFDIFNSITSRTTHTIDYVIEFMKYVDTFFLDLVAEYNWKMSTYPKNFDSIIERIPARVKAILVELNGSNSNGRDWISVNINEEFSDDMIDTLLHEFWADIYMLKYMTKPYNFELALNLMVEEN